MRNVVVLNPSPQSTASDLKKDDLFSQGPCCFVPPLISPVVSKSSNNKSAQKDEKSLSTVLVSLPPSPLAAGLAQVLGALDVEFVSAAPTRTLLDSASLWVCGRPEFEEAVSIPDHLRVIIFDDSVPPLSASNIVQLHPATPTAVLLDLAAAWTSVQQISLSNREREVLSLVSKGFSNEEIAAECFVSTATVKTHLLRSFRKLGVSDRAAAVYKAVRMGLIV